jgi:hypothetical protein
MGGSRACVPFLLRGLAPEGFAPWLVVVVHNEPDGPCRGPADLRRLRQHTEHAQQWLRGRIEEAARDLAQAEADRRHLYNPEAWLSQRTAADVLTTLYSCSKTQTGPSEDATTVPALSAIEAAKPGASSARGSTRVAASSHGPWRPWRR